MKIDLWIKKNKILSFLYIFSLIFFIYQHTTGLSWDFSVYVLNAKYLFGQGIYFEWLRPPLTPVIIGIFSVFGWLIAEYLYIIFVVTLYCFATVKLAEKLKIKPALLYIFLITPFILNYSLVAGNYLLALALILLTISAVPSPTAGAFLGLATLTDYKCIIFLPLLLFNKNFKKIILAIALFIAILLPWLLFNYFVTGNALTSIADSFFLNITNTERVSMQVNFAHLLDVINISLPFFIFGLIKRLKQLKRIDLIMLFIVVLSFFSYSRIPFKHPIYMIYLIIPVAYFSSIALTRIKKILPLLIIVNIILAIHSFFPLPDTTIYKQATENIDDCMLYSNAWVFFDYFGIPSAFVPKTVEKTKEVIESGGRVLIFSNLPDPPYATNKTLLLQFPLIKETKNYLLFGNVTKCEKPYIVDTPLTRGMGNCEIFDFPIICK